MKISFDFDGTLENKNVQSIAKFLLTQGHTICILTTRYEDVREYMPCSHISEKLRKRAHLELYEIARSIGITEIHFTNFIWKTEVIDKFDIDIHLDDNYEDEVLAINNNNKARAIYYSTKNLDWIEELANELQKPIKS